MDVLVTGHWHVMWFEYLLYGLALQLGVRICMSLLSALYLRHDSTGERYWRLFIYTLAGVHHGGRTDIKSDLWFPFFLGLIEIYCYPVLMVASAWTAIGAWIGLKTVAEWSRWTADRLLFHRYLIGTALVVVLSLALT